MAQASAEDLPVKSVATAFKIVETVKELGGARLGEIATRLDLPTSTVSDYLVTLRANQYLVRDGSTYRVGLRFLELGDHARNYRNIYQYARPKIDQLADETGELVHLAVEENALGVIVYETEGEHAVSLDTYVGRRVHLHSTALGKAMLARMTDDQVADVIDRHGLPGETDRTITTEAELYDALERIRDRKYAVSEGERIEGLGCVAVAITDATGERPLGAISVCGPTSRLESDRFQNDIPRQIQQAADRIELDLRYR